jgi:exopolysaccharide production protein ExoZ
MNPAYWHARAFGGAFIGGHAGVEFFFVLSGFIIAHVHARDVGRPDRLRRYLARRFDRVYPLYWLVLTGVVALTLLGPNIPSLRHVDAAVIARSYLLIGGDSHDGVLTVSWTLFHEILFYAAFATAIVGRRAGLVVGALWLAAISLGATVGFDAVPAYVTSPLNLLFALGVLTQIAVRQRRIRRPMLWIVVGLLAFVALAAEEALADGLGETLRNLLYGVASAVALAGIVTREREHRFSIPAALSVLGAASYSIYLVHYPALSIVARVLQHAGLIAAVPENIGFVLLCGAVVSLGVAVHYGVERPLLAGLRQWRAERDLRRVGAVVGESEKLRAMFAVR